MAKRKRTKGHTTIYNYRIGWHICKSTDVVYLCVLHTNGVCIYVYYTQMCVFTCTKNKCCEHLRILNTLSTCTTHVVYMYYTQCLCVLHTLLTL